MSPIFPPSCRLGRLPRSSCSWINCATVPVRACILIALEGGDAETRAELSVALARKLRSDREFSHVGNGEEVTAARDREFLFAHRYLLSAAVTPEHFTPSGLEESMQETVADLASPEGLTLQDVAVRDPTGEMLTVIDQLLPHSGAAAQGRCVDVGGRRTHTADRGDGRGGFRH